MLFLRVQSVLHKCYVLVGFLGTLTLRSAKKLEVNLVTFSFSLSLCLSVSPTFVWKLPSRRAQKGKSYQRFWRLHRNLLSPTPYLDIDLVNFDKTVRWRRREGERSDRKEPLYIQLSCMLTCDYMLLWKQRTAKGYTFPQFLHTLNDDKI